MAMANPGCGSDPYPQQHTHTRSVHRGGYALWRWSAEELRWSLIKDASEPGFEPGLAPDRAGQFEGQIVRWPTEPGVG
jgi:hypothetical protein